MSQANRSVDPARPLSVPDMVDDYVRRQQALELEARELAHLQAELLNAAEREASAIVTDARAKVSRALVEARRELLNLASRVRRVADLDVEHRALVLPHGGQDAASHLA